MNIFNRIISGIFKSRDKPQNALMGSMQFFFGRSAAGQTVNERTAMQVTAVYACVRILSESIAGLKLTLEGQEQSLQNANRLLQQYEAEERSRLRKIKRQRNIAYVIAAACIYFAVRKL